MAVLGISKDEPGYLPQHERPKGYWHSTKALLHPGRALFVYCFLVWGAVFSPAIRWDYLALSFVAFFGALQVAAYSLDELTGRHTGTSVSDRELKARTAAGMCLAVSVGIFLTLAATWLILPFWLFGLFIIFSYNLELWGGPFHNSRWFGITWGSLVLLGSNILHANTITPPALFGAVAAFYLSQEEIRSYGLTGCRQSNFCRDYVRDRGRTLCHGQVCDLRLSMAPEATKLSWRIIRGRWAAMLAVTGALIAWRVIGP